MGCRDQATKQELQKEFGEYSKSLVVEAGIKGETVLATALLDNTIEDTDTIEQELQNEVG